MASDRTQTKNKLPVTLPPTLDRERFLNVEQVAVMYGFSVQHIRRLYSTGRFPKPLKIGGNKCGWRVGSLIDFNTAKAA